MGIFRKIVHASPYLYSTTRFIRLSANFLVPSKTVDKTVYLQELQAFDRLASTVYPSADSAYSIKNSEAIGR